MSSQYPHPNPKQNHDNAVTQDHNHPFDFDPANDNDSVSDNDDIYISGPWDRVTKLLQVRESTNQTVDESQVLKLLHEIQAKTEVTSDNCGSLYFCLDKADQMGCLTIVQGILNMEGFIQHFSLEDKEKVFRIAARNRLLPEVNRLLQDTDIHEMIRRKYPVFQNESASSILFGNVTVKENNNGQDRWKDSKTLVESKSDLHQQEGLKELMVNLLVLSEMMRKRCEEFLWISQEFYDYENSPKDLEDPKTVKLLRAQMDHIIEIARKYHFHTESNLWNEVDLATVLNYKLGGPLFVDDKGHSFYEISFPSFTSFCKTFTEMGNPLLVAVHSNDVQKVYKLLQDESVGKISANDRNAALRVAAIKGHWFVLLGLLKNPKVLEGASQALSAIVKSRGQFRSIIAPEKWAIIFKLLNTNSVQQELEKPSKMQEVLRLLCYAIQHNNMANVQKFLQYPLICSALSGQENSALNEAKEREHWLIFLELLKHQYVEIKPENNNPILASTMAAQQMGIQPDDPMTEVLNHYFLSDNQALYPKNSNQGEHSNKTEKALLKLLEDKTHQERLTTGFDCLLFHIATMKGYSHLVSKLLDIKTIEDGHENSFIAGNSKAIEKAFQIAAANADLATLKVLLPYVQEWLTYSKMVVNDPSYEQDYKRHYRGFIRNINDTFKQAVCFGHWPVVLELAGNLGLQDASYSMALYYAVSYHQWSTVKEMLNLPIFTRDEGSPLTYNNHAVLRRAIELENIPMTCEIVKTYVKAKIQLPQGLKYKFEGAEHPLETLLQEGRKSTFADDVKTTSDDATMLLSEGLERNLPRQLCWLALNQYGALTPKLDDIIPLLQTDGPYSDMYSAKEEDWTAQGKKTAKAKSN